MTVFSASQVQRRRYSVAKYRARFIRDGRPIFEPLERRVLLNAPSPPNIAVNYNAGAVAVSWNKVGNATSYDIYRSTQTGHETLYQSGITGTTWTDTNVTGGAAYYYEATALNSSGESGKSNEASFIPQATNSIGPSNVLVIYNADWAGDQDANGVQDSLQVAQYYAQVHGVPSQNLLGIHGGPAAGQSGWESWASTPYTTFFNNLVTPVVNALNTLGQNNIDVLLFCYGIRDIAPPAASGTQPTNVSLDDAMAAPYLLTATSGIPEINNPYMDPAPGFDASPGHFTHQYTVNHSPMYLVSRLDGPRGLWDALEQIDQAQYAQKYLYPGAGYFNGTVYVDDEARDAKYTDAYLQASTYVQTGNYSNYGPADENIAQTEHYLLNSALPLKWQNSGVLIGDTGATFTDGSSAASAPNALFFSGWYGWTKNSNVYQWLPGSVADNLISDSMIGLEGNGALAATAQMLGEGLTAGVGTVNEPYVDGHPRPNILIYYLLKGYSFAEAAMLSTPYLGWMGQNVGDPLYTPFDPNKTATKDTTTPMPASGFNPAAGWWDVSGNYHLNLSIDNTNGPEVASAVVQFGLTTSYGNTASSPAFYERPDLTLTGVTAGLTYHMKLTLTNAVGTVWTSSDYIFTVPPKTIYQDTFTNPGNLRYKKPTIDSTGTAAKWDQITGSGTEIGSTLSVSGTAYVYLPLTTSTLQTTAGTYTLTAQIHSTGASDQWVALGFGKAVSSPFANANAMATLNGPASGGSGGTASTYYGTGTTSSGNPATGTVHGNGIDTISVILTTDGLGGATVSFSDTAGFLPPNSGGALTSAQLANINDVFLGSNGTAVGTFSNLTLTFTPADTSTTTVTSSLNPSAYGQSVTFTATVAAGHVGTGTPGGTVTFMDGTATLGTGTLNGSGIATFTTSTLSAASHAITAVYGGDANHTGSTSSAVTQTVNNILPDVIGVFVKDTTWSQSFLDYLAANSLGDATLGYAIPTGPSQLATLPWAGLNQISITFNENITTTQAALTLTGLSATYPSSTFSYNATTHVATWTFASQLPTDAYQLSLPSASVTDAANNQLDGEWTDGSSTHSGDGSPGGDFLFHLNILPGDMNNSGRVDLSDYNIWFTNLQTSTFNPALGDLNASGFVDLSDFDIWFSHLQQSLSSSSLTQLTPGESPGAVSLSSTLAPSSPGIAIPGSTLQPTTDAPTSKRHLTPDESPEAIRLPLSPPPIVSSLVIRPSSFPRPLLPLLHPTLRHPRTPHLPIEPIDPI